MFFYRPPSVLVASVGFCIKDNGVLVEVLHFYREQEHV